MGWAPSTETTKTAAVMFIAAAYNRMITLAIGWLIILACVFRVTTNYLYGIHYQDPDPVFWEDLYYKGQAVFELFMLIGAAGMAKRYLPDGYFLTVSYFADLAVYAWIKEYFLNPMEWQVFEEAGFVFSLILLVLRLTISRQRRNKILNLFKYIFK